MSTTTKPFDYAAFIDALRDLLQLPRFSGGMGEPMHSQNHGFIQWKQKLVFLLEQIERQGYQVPIKVRTRSFDMPGFLPNHRPLSIDVFTRQNRWFQHACVETDAEINAVIEHFDRYGQADASVLRNSQGFAPVPEHAPQAAVSKPFDYAAFIDELSVLRESYANPPSNHRTHDSLEFKRWRHQVRDLIDRIEGKGYKINCRISGRQFRVMSSASISPRAQQAAFDQALGETMIELSTIISNFEKYGDPKASTPAPTQVLSPPLDPAPKQALEWNKEATLEWYLKNTPAAALWGFVGILLSMIGGAFYLGTAFEKRWPESKPSVVGDHASNVLSPQDQKVVASQPLSAAPVGENPIGGQAKSDPEVQLRLNAQPASGLGAGSHKAGEQLGLGSGTSAPQPVFTAPK